MFFDRSLGWAAKKKQRILRRRIPSERNGEHSGHLQGMTLPSWSWVGWYGAVDLFGHDVPGTMDVSFRENTIPITTWYTSNSLAGARRRITFTWYKDRDTSNTKEPLPSVQSLGNEDISQCMQVQRQRIPLLRQPLPRTRNAHPNTMPILRNDPCARLCPS